MRTLAFEEAELILHNIENCLLYREDSILYPRCHGVTAIHCPAQNRRSLKLFHTRLQREDERRKRRRGGGRKEEEEERKESQTTSKN